MRKLMIVAIVFVCTLLQTFEAFAWTDKRVEKEKKVHNQYTVREGEKLVIDNMYGKVHINTWDKNEITIDITVTAKAKTEDEAQEILDRISFVASGDEDGGRQVYCKTVLAPQKHNIQESSMQIDYTINTPKKNAIDITNKYGDVFLADFMGKMRMNVSYGGLDIRAIHGGDKRIKVAFGSAIVGSVESGTFDISYSNLTIDDAGDIDVTNKYGNSDITEVQNLKVDQKYGNIEIGSVGSVTGNIDYTNFEIGDLKKSADLALKYCGKANIKSVGPGVEQLNIGAHYSSLSCHFAEGASLSADVATSYSSIKKAASFGPIELVDLNSNNANSQHYKIKIGAGKGSMTIDAHYSNINFK